ncbi:techylectin-5A-like [Mercenaria mercenaria]|uniref:techylectin-5A-like n=1 Tax=Mercenaria mercenaria TaxID=6596 RepID=UPI00234F07CA|nr:techylectin-5A-like [Mercenaria mercenaria]
MDVLFKNGLTLCLLIYFVKFSSVFCDGVSFKKYFYNDNDYGKCLPNTTAFESKAQDPVACGKMCHLNNACESFHYQPETHQCFGCRYKRYDAPPLRDDEKRTRSMYFTPVENFPSDCKDILQNNIHAKTGVHEIKLWKSRKTLNVFCDMDTAGGGWTVFQNRFDGAINFNENFTAYETGFGELEGEFWLGLRYVQEIADQSATEIRLDLSDGFGREGYEAFQDFRLSETFLYTLHIRKESRSFSGGREQFEEASTGFASNNGYYFAARDRLKYQYCVDGAESGWWHVADGCGGVDLNAHYLNPGTPLNESTQGFKHFGFAGRYSLRASKMMIRRN